MCLVACGRTTLPCGVMRLGTSDRLTVVSSYGWASYFSDRCERATPREVTIAGDGYSVYVYLMANQDPKVFLGVTAADGQPRELQGARLFGDSPGSVFAGRATHMTRLSALNATWRVNSQAFQPAPNTVLDFRVINKNTGNAVSYSFPIDFVRCTCVTYEGP